MCSLGLNNSSKGRPIQRRIILGCLPPKMITIERDTPPIMRRKRKRKRKRKKIHKRISKLLTEGYSVF